MPVFTVNPYDPANLPSGFDRADGLESRIGTATPTGAVAFDHYSGSYGSVGENMLPEELPDSPTIERAEQATITHTYRCGWDVGKQLIEFYGRGVVWEDSEGRLTKVLSSSLQHEHGDTCLLTIISEGISFDNPPDHFSVVPVELGINIIKHPRYFYAFLGAGYGSATERANQMVIRMLQNYFENTTAAYRDALSQKLWDSIGFAGGATDPNPVWTVINEDTGQSKWNVGYKSDGTPGTTKKIPGTEMAKRAALEIIQKYWRNTETPYLIGYQITWSQYFWLPQYLNPGGYIEDPITDGGLPSYFWDPESGGNIFSLTAWFNPQSYSLSRFSNGSFAISWLRKADEVEWERTWFRVTKTWMGSAVGFWDTELYTAQSRPQNPNDYLYTAPA